MTAPHTLTVCLPGFPGFYESDLSQAVDWEEDQWLEYHTDDNGETGPDYESAWPEPLRLSNDMGEMMLHHVDHKAAYLSLARSWADAFDYHAGEVLQMTVPDTRQRWTGEAFVTEPYARPSLGMAFESMDSPREYNFTTDRVYSTIPLKTLREILKRSAADRHETLARVIKDRHSSCSGFVSFYETDVRAWLKKPLRKWDHNELGTLLWAALELSGADMESRKYYSGFFADVRETATENEGAYQAWESAVNWPAFDAGRAAARAVKLAAWRVVDPAAIAAWETANPDYVATLTPQPESVT